MKKQFVVVMALCLIAVASVSYADGNAEVLITQGINLENQGDVKGAIRLYKRATRADPKNDYAYLRLP